MLVDALLRWFVVVGDYRQYGVELRAIHALGLFDNVGGTVAAAAYYQGHATSDVVGHELFYVTPLLGAECRRFGRSAQHHKIVHPVFYLIVEQACQRPDNRLICLLNGVISATPIPLRLICDIVSVKGSV